MTNHQHRSGYQLILNCLINLRVDIRAVELRLRRDRDGEQGGCAHRAS
jgi:hypothetical protein